MGDAQIETICKVIRWTARIAGTLLASLFTIILIGIAIVEGIAPLGSLPAGEVVQFAAVVLMLAGVLAAWRWEQVGGGMITTGGVLFNLVESITEGQVRLVWFAVVFTAIGVMFIVCGWMRPTA